MFKYISVFKRSLFAAAILVIFLLSILSSNSSNNIKYVKNTPNQSIGTSSDTSLGRLSANRTNTTSSVNIIIWSGFVAGNLNSKFSEIDTTFVFPKNISCTKNNSDVSFWIGIDGYYSSTIEQEGLSADCSLSNGKLVPNYFAWSQMYPNTMQYVNIPVAPGDEFYLQTSTTGNNMYNFILKNITKNVVSSTKYLCSNRQNLKCNNAGVEWIVEEGSYCANNQCTKTILQPLTNFGSVTFQNCYATEIEPKNNLRNSLGNYSNISLEMTRGTGGPVIVQSNKQLNIGATSFVASQTKN